MGRKKASEKKDNYVDRIVYISKEEPLTFDIYDKKGKKLPKYVNIIIKKENKKEVIREFFHVVKKSIRSDKPQFFNYFNGLTSEFTIFNEDNYDPAMEKLNPDNQFF